MKACAVLLQNYNVNYKLSYRKKILCKRKGDLSLLNQLVNDRRIGPTDLRSAQTTLLGGMLCSAVDILCLAVLSVPGDTRSGAQSQLAQGKEARVS